MSLLPFLARFPDDNACWAHLEAVRWPAGATCPKCGSVNQATRLTRPHYWQCRACRAAFTAAMGTALEGTHLPMRAWFTALYLVAASSKGISSVKLGQHLGIGQKTAWFLGRRIRRMMEDKDGLLRGIVEVDETYLGGKQRPKGQASKRDGDDDQPKGLSGSRKSMVTVATERGGKARAARGRTHSGKTIATCVLNNVDRIGTVLVTDELPAYRWIRRKFPAHLHVNHSKGEYVRPDRHAAATAHVNTAESFNATLKRAWPDAERQSGVGVFHWFSVKHTDRYLGETTFRWNARRQDTDARLADLFTRTTGRLRWKELVA